KVGDYQEEDAPLADLMTDKATVEMTAPVSGRLTALAGAVGEQVAIGAVLAVFETEKGFSVAGQIPHTPVSTPVLEAQSQDPPYESGALKGEAHWEEEDRTGTAPSPAE